MNQRSNQPDGDPPPQKAKKKPKKPDDAPREMPLVPTRDDAADYRLCAVELRACARDVRGWKSRQTDFLRRSLESILRHHDAAVGRIGFPHAVEMEPCDDGVWCSVVFITPTGGWSHRLPLGPRRRQTYEPQIVEIEPDEEEAIRDSLDPSTIETLERLQTEWGTSDRPLSFVEVVAMCMHQAEWTDLRRRRAPKQPVLATPALDAARQRAVVPSVASGLPAAPREAAIAQLAERLFAEEFEVVQLIAGAFETLADCVDFLADFKPPELDAKEKEALVRMLAAEARSERSAIAIKSSASSWRGPLGDTIQTRQRNASLAVGRLKRARLVAPEGHSEKSYLTAKGIRVASTIRAERARQ